MVDFDRDYYLLGLPLFVFGDFREVAQTEMSDVSPSMCLQTILVEAGPPISCPPNNNLLRVKLILLNISAGLVPLISFDIWQIV